VCKIGEDTTSPLEVPIFGDEKEHGGDYFKPRTLLSTRQNDEHHHF